ncbi:MAG: hypothetical protein H7249_12435 [Chitinophagaceae bacterium]|nr:hypothetical protein [Oligoflexus sp.]
MKYISRREEILAKISDKAKADAASKAADDQVAINLAAAQPSLHADHPKPRTRRELLGAGLMSGLAYAMIPSIFTLTAQKAFAAPVCSKSGESTGAIKTPGYLHLELSGGLAMSGNFMIGKQGFGADFAPLASGGYAALGLGSSQIPGKVALDAAIKGQFHPASAFLAGMKSVMSAEAMAKTVAVGMAGTSADDSANNPLNPTQLVAKVNGLQGSLVQLVGSGSQPNTLGKTMPLNVAQDPGLAKAFIKDEASLTNLVNPGLIATRFNKKTDASNITAELAHQLSASKLAVLQNKDIPQDVKDLVECGYLGAKDLVNLSAAALTPSTDKIVSGTNFNALTFASLNKPNTPSQKGLIMGKLLVDGNASCATIEVDGCDYHGKGRVAQDAKDFICGQTVGIALEIAHRKAAPLFVALTSDGSVSSQGAGGAADRFDFTSDNGTHGMVMMIAIGSTERPNTKSLQIGAYNDAGAVDSTVASLTAKTAAAQALCIAYNYAAFSGRMAQFESTLSASGTANPFKGAESTYLAFEPKV